MDEHSLQSPFLFNLYQNALKPTCRRKVLDREIEELRRQLISDNRAIDTNHFGSGSSMIASQAKQIRRIAKSGISRRKQTEVLVNLIEISQSQNILELGTSLGINSIYMSRGSGVKQVITVDGNAELMQIAKGHFELLKAGNIKTVVSDIDNFLDQEDAVFDFIYIDANHTYDATLRYVEKALRLVFQKGVIVVDDINWSPEMAAAWSRIIKTHTNHLYIENDKLGIVFVNHPAEMSHHVLRF